MTNTPSTIAGTAPAAASVTAIADCETFSVKLPARIASYLSNVAAEEGKTPEQFIAAAAACASVAIDESRGDQDSWREEAEAANG